ncbi:GAF domain-containing protein [Mycolicibacterium sp. A43C]
MVDVYPDRAGGVLLPGTEQMCLFTPKADGAAVSILAPSDQFVVVSAFGVVESLLGLRLPVAGIFQGMAVAAGRPQLSDDAPNDPAVTAEVRAIGARLGLRTLAVFPLRHRDTAIGALSMTSTQPGRFDERDISASTFISGLISAHTELSALLEAFMVDPNLPDDSTWPRYCFPIWRARTDCISDWTPCWQIRPTWTSCSSRSST